MASDESLLGHAGWGSRRGRRCDRGRSAGGGHRQPWQQRRQGESLRRTKRRQCHRHRRLWGEKGGCILDRGLSVYALCMNGVGYIVSM